MTHSYEKTACAATPCPRWFQICLVDGKLWNGRDLVERTPEAVAAEQARFGWKDGRCKECAEILTLAVEIFAP